MEHIDEVNNDDDNLMFDFDYMLSVVLILEKELQHSDIKRIDHPKQTKFYSKQTFGFSFAYIMSPYTWTFYMIKFS